MPRFDLNRLDPGLRTEVNNVFSKLDALKRTLRSDREKGGIDAVELEFERALSDATSRASADYRISMSMPRIDSAANLLMEVFRGADNTKVNNAEEIKDILVNVIAPGLTRQILGEFK